MHDGPRVRRSVPLTSRSTFAWCVVQRALVVARRRRGNQILLRRLTGLAIGSRRILAHAALREDLTGHADLRLRHAGATLLNVARNTRAVSTITNACAVIGARRGRRNLNGPNNLGALAAIDSTIRAAVCHIVASRGPPRHTPVHHLRVTGRLARGEDRWIRASRNAIAVGGDHRHQCVRSATAQQQAGEDQAVKSSHRAGSTASMYRIPITDPLRSCDRRSFEKGTQASPGDQPQWRLSRIQRK